MICQGREGANLGDAAPFQCSVKLAGDLRAEVGSGHFAPMISACAAKAAFGRPGTDRSLAAF
jgi:hypothetical protein